MLFLKFQGKQDKTAKHSEDPTIDPDKEGGGYEEYGSYSGKTSQCKGKTRYNEFLVVYQYFT